MLARLGFITNPRITYKLWQHVHECWRKQTDQRSFTDHVSVLFEAGSKKYQESGSKSALYEDHSEAWRSRGKTVLPTISLEQSKEIEKIQADTGDKFEDIVAVFISIGYSSEC